MKKRGKNPEGRKAPKDLHQAMLEAGVPARMALGAVSVAIGARPSMDIGANDFGGCAGCLKATSRRIQDAISEAGYEDEVSTALVRDPAAGIFEVWFFKPDFGPLLQGMLEGDESACARLAGVPCFDGGGRWVYALVVGDDELTSWRCNRRSTKEVAAVAEAWSRALKGVGLRVRIAMVETMSEEALLEALSDAIRSKRDLREDERSCLGRLLLEADFPRASADVLAGGSGLERFLVWRTLLRTIMSGLSDPGGPGAFDLEGWLYDDAALPLPRADCPDDGTPLEECAGCGRTSYCPTHDVCPFDAGGQDHDHDHGHDHDHDHDEDDGEEWRRGTS